MVRIAKLLFVAGSAPALFPKKWTRAHSFQALKLSSATWDEVIVTAGSAQ